MAPARDRIVLDVRGLEPPQPMVRVLEEIDRLGPGAELEVHHERRPMFLYPQLDERGFDPRDRRAGAGAGAHPDPEGTGVNPSARPRPASGLSPIIPLAYLVCAAVAFVAASLSVAWLAPELAGHYYHPRLLALTHTVTLGWITLAIMGASYQLIPIVLERPIWSERLARWQLAILAVAVTGMVAHF